MTGFTVRSLRSIVWRLRADQCGATAIEYALIASGVSVAIMTTVFGVGSNLQANWYAKIANIFN